MQNAKTAIVIVAWMILSLGLFGAQTANACGGQTASMGQAGDRLVAWTHEDGNPRAMDYRGNIKPAELFIPPALADAIAARYVSLYYPNADALDFHAFLFEHGSYVYMYDVTDASIRNTSTITACGSNPQRSESNAMDLHIDAVTGDVWDGEGCGGGPSRVVMSFNASDYPGALASEAKNLMQFHSEFVIPKDGAQMGHGREDGVTELHQAIVVDGHIDEREWSGAARTRLEQYGKTLEIRSRIDEGVLYWAVEADTKNWLALLLKNSPHHGMVWEFTDAKLLTKDGVEDYHVVYKGMMAGAELQTDGTSTVLQQATSETDDGRVYEFAMPLQSGAEGVDFRLGEYGNMAFYFGSTDTFSGDLVYDDAFSKHILVHVGEEIHRSVLSSIVPEAIAATFADGERATEESAPLSRNIGMYIILAVVAGALALALRKPRI